MLNKKSITNKYLRAFILIIVLPTLLIIVLLNRVYTNTLMDNTSDMIQQAMEQISIGVDNEIKRISLLASTISNDDEIMDLVTKWNRSDIDIKFNISKQIDSKLNYIFGNSSDVESVVFFFKNGGAYYFKNNPIVEEKTIKEMPWYIKTLENQGKVLVLGSLKSFTNNSWNQYVLSVSISPNISGIRNDVEAVYYGFRTNIFSSFYSNYKLTSEGQMFIIDDNYKIIVSKDQSYMAKDIRETGYISEPLDGSNSSFPKSVNGKKYLVSVYNIQKADWKIVSIIEYNILTQDVNKVSVNAIAITVAILLFFIWFSIYFFRDIIIPIKNMIMKMKNVEQGDFNTTIDIDRNDELQELGKSFNRMVQEIKKLIVERDTKEREKNKAEIEVLQSQINPHFLSNTLNSIRLMSMIARVDSIKNITEAFIKLLSASFAKSGKFITIDEELDNLRNYISIMKIRYGDKFNVNIEIDEQIRNRYLLRLILQPIIENAILHGISELEERGEITVTGYEKDNDILFVIRDNGIGMTPEQINNLLSEDIKNTRGFSSIGIKNVHKRIQLNHGSRYGLNIESSFGEYTQVSILLPSIINSEDEALHA